MMDYISYPKLNICFKILDIGDYCTIASRYIKVVDNFFDVISICDSTTFSLSCNFDCKMEDNLVFKAKEALKNKLIQLKQIDSNDNKRRNISNFNKIKYLDKFKIYIDKNIPIFAGLGGGSSNAASYLVAMNDLLELDFTKRELASIAFNVGSDVCFFIYDVISANVFGKGEIVEIFNDKFILESMLDNKVLFEIITPPIKCDTKRVFSKFKSSFYDEKIDNNIDNLLKLDSKDIIDGYNMVYLNDLYLPSLDLYPELKDYAKSGYYFSGSGSSFFRMIN